ncbi:MAG: SUF system NifU family Fe-S cluster assembly protein [Verrucomicrobia bacterium]|nr:SUF system NifU family Fe-S cluster assembly protein [Verrucomicrobiota bacterium]
MSNLENLYQDIILEHNNRPRNRRALASATHRAKGYNPACGDEVEVYLSVKAERIEDACFQGQGCAISQASASLLTEAVVGLSLSEAKALQLSVQEMLHDPNWKPRTYRLAELSALSGVRRFPARYRCALLAWDALALALSDAQR